MSTLGKKALLEFLQNPDQNERLIVTPILSEKQIGDVSIDVRLGNQFIVFRLHTRSQLNAFQLDETELRRIQERQIVRFGQKFVLHPGSLTLASTFEYLKLPNTLEGQVEGRSSWARLGLQIATATCIEPGFCGVVTLELSNVGTMPLELYPGMRIAQLVFRTVHSPSAISYTGEHKYKFPIGPQFSRLAHDSEAKIFIN